MHTSKTAREVGRAEAPFLEFLIVIARHKRVLMVGTAGCALLTLVIFLFVPDRYTATTTFLAPQQQQSISSALLGQLSGANALGAAVSGLGFKPSSELYVTLLKSRFVEDPIMTQFHLQTCYRSKRFSDARRILESRTTISTSKDGVVTVSVEDKDPERSAQIANAYVAQLQLLTSQLAITEAARRRAVFEQQIEKTQIDLVHAESALNQMQKKSGLIQPDSQARVTIYALASLRAQIAAKEVEAGSLRASETNENPNVRLVDREITELQGQLSSLERKQNAGNGDIQVPTTAVPDLEMEYLRRLREEKMQEALYELLMKQYEAARIDEAREGSLVQIVDPAVKQDKKSFPKRGLITLGGGILGFIITAFLLVLMDAKDRAIQKEEIRERIFVLERALKWKS